MKNSIIKYLSVVLIIGLMTACDKDFETINQNPNAPLAVPGSLLLPDIIRGSINSVTNESWSIGNIVAQHTAKIQFVNEDRYLWGERNEIWNSFYNRLRNVENLLTSARTGKQANYEAVGLIMKSWMYATLTDCYGDVPYSKAIQAKSGSVNAPVYDSQESIYTGILADLARANTLIGTTVEKVDGDILYNGNMTQWKRLANSLRVRYMMRISAKKSVGADLKALVDNATQNPLFGSNTDNATLIYLNAAPNQFPLHTSRVGSFDEIRLSFRLDSVLEGFNDPRLTIFARPTASSTTTPQYVGIPNGLNDNDALLFNGGPQNVSRIGALFYENAITTQGLQAARGVLMTYAELQFLLAEAAQKGLITGDAKGFYEKGIASSFSYYGLTMPTDYLTRAGVSFSTTTATAQIAEQKWISLFFQGIEAWLDWRRTGLPAIRPGAANLNNNRIPVRFIYPTSEQALNAANRKEAADRQFGATGEDINGKMWLIK
jgi:Starch-binding associating with outer membrane